MISQTDISLIASGERIPNWTHLTLPLSALDLTAFPEANMAQSLVPTCHTCRDWSLKSVLRPHCFRNSTPSHVAQHAGAHQHVSLTRLALEPSTKNH